MVISQQTIEKYKDYLILSSLAKRTVETYVENLLHINNSNAFDSLKKLQQFFKTKKQSVGDHRFSALVLAARKFSDWAIDRNFIKKNLHLEITSLRGVPKSRKKTKLDLFAYTDAQCDLILDACRKFTERGLFFIAMKTGVRANALLQLKISDFKFTNKIPTGLVVRSEIVKTHNPRYIPITENNQDFLQNYFIVRDLKELDSDFVFTNGKGNPLKYNSTISWRLYQRLSKECGFRVTLHNCRYTFGVNVWKKTKDLYLTQYLLGHKDPNQTVRYLKIKEDYMKKLVIQKLRGVEL